MRMMAKNSHLLDTASKTYIRGPVRDVLSRGQEEHDKRSIRLLLTDHRGANRYSILYTL